jgi:hypothetical protein
LNEDITMCINIRTALQTSTPPSTDEEIRAAALQFVRKVSGFNKPSKAKNEPAFPVLGRRDRAYLDPVAPIARKPTRRRRIGRKRSLVRRRAAEKRFPTPRTRVGHRTLRRATYTVPQPKQATDDE